MTPFPLPPFVHKLAYKRAQKMVERIEPFINSSKRVIDIGSGPCYIAKILQEKGKVVSPVDIQDNSFVKNIQPTVYDGKSLPFKDKSFDVALLITVLHHTPQPQVVFKEATRVAKNIVVIETSYKSFLEKVFIVLFDTLLNWQFKFYWNSYKSDSKWKEFFKENNVKLLESKEYYDQQAGASYFHPLYYIK